MMSAKVEIHERKRRRGNSLNMALGNGLECTKRKDSKRERKA